MGACLRLAAASDLASPGFALGSGLRHLSNRWSSQLNTVLDACARIADHMRVTKKIHNGDEAYLQRQMNSIDVPDADFDERVGGSRAFHRPLHEGRRDVGRV
ncbi:hypothetical protein ACIRPP_00870 [Streptomyces sp. NPDC101219]|uniref:hypothetical protein n=1 Tax=Streptomyces sp. NPDC101219 TaxID=3366131 RepID=UPI00380B6017